MRILIFLFGILIGYMVLGVIWVRTANKLNKNVVLKGYHFHHSLFFVPAFSLALLFSGNISIFLWGTGLGVVIQHTVEEGFIFITRE